MARVLLITSPLISVDMERDPSPPSANGASIAQEGRIAATANATAERVKNLFILFIAVVFNLF